MRTRNSLRLAWLASACVLASVVAAYAQRTVTIVKGKAPVQNPTTRPAGRSGATSQPAPPPLSGSAYALPNNFYGAHLLVDDGLVGTRGYTQLQWVRHLVGRWGYAKTLFAGIDRHMHEPPRGWIDYVQACYKLELIPVLRLGGHWREGGWVAPEPDGPGDYHSMATAVADVVKRLPRSDMCPLYIEIWNEPNLAVEWSGKPDPQQYADFFVQVADAIRSLGDARIRILNGGLATNPAWVEKLCQANPRFVNSFDVWASHPYPQNHPPSLNHHAGNVPADSPDAIDAYMPDLKVLRRFGRKDVKVMITETGYALGNSAFEAAGFPVIDEANRAAYMARAFRDYYPKWPEVLAVLPFEFCDTNWERFNWVYPESGTTQEGIPTKPHYQYTAVAALAKPTDKTGALSGQVTVADLGSPVEDARIVVRLKPQGATSDVLGNYYLGSLEPGRCEIIVSKPGFKSMEQKVNIAPATNTVAGFALVAEETRTLSGTVRSGDDDKPLWGAKITLSPGKHSATTDRKGRYEFPECIPGRYTLHAESRGLEPYEATVQVEVRSRNEHDFVLGRVSDSSNWRRGAGRSIKPDSQLATNMLSNPSFEAGPGGGGKPGIGLSFEPLTPYRLGSVLVSDRRAHTGRYSQEIRMSPDVTAVRQITYYGTARPEGHYIASGWIRTDTTDRDASAWISLSATRNDGSVLKEELPRSKIVGRSEGWVWMEVLLTAPAEAQRLSLNLSATGSRGMAYFDDLMLRRTDPPGSGE